MQPAILKSKSIQATEFILLVCCSMALTSCASVDKYSFEKIGYTNYPFQSGNFKDISTTYEEATKQKDKNYALWNNQLGSIYLAQGDYDKALDYFLKAYYLMNDIPAFKELERKAISLTGSEDRKAYKGDPYEKSMNSLYVGLLFYNKGDLDNAMAAFKNGILADSESKGEVYKSDIAILYLFASRVAKEMGNQSLSDDYCNAIKELYSSPNYSLLGFNNALTEKTLNLKNNVFLIFEFGEGPSKSRRGQYGELAVINERRFDINNLTVKIDGKINPGNQVYSDTNVYFQASTRGGRKMDSILKGKAQFKTDAANTSVQMLNLSNQFVNQANQVRAANPYADTSGYAAAATITALFAGGSAIASAITNPKADIRHWGLLPEHIIVFPLYLTPGKHKIGIDFIEWYSRGINQSGGVKLDYEMDVDIQKNKDNIVLKRLLRYQATKKTEVPAAKISQQGVDNRINHDLTRELVTTGMKFDIVEMTLGVPTEKRRDSLGREVWIYPSNKPGFSNCVYFMNGRVIGVENKSVKDIIY